MIFSHTWNKIITLFQKYERHLSSLALVFGFTVDSFTLTRIDLWLDNLILIGYLSIALVSIIIMNLYEGNFLRKKVFYYVSTFAPLPMQYAFGGLFSGFVIFYTRSASLIASWPFLLLLAGLLIGNEFFRTRYARLSFQISVFFLSLFSYSVFAVPIIVGEIGPRIFVLSGGVSLVVIWVIVLVLRIFIPKRINESKKILLRSIGSIFVAMNALYLFNIIPPIPLSLKEAGVYQKIVRTPEGNFELTGAKQTFISRFLPYKNFTIQENQPVYFFSAVFAPTNLNTNIVHQWEYFDRDKKGWQDSSRIEFPINGGRDRGYRGFSIKRNIFSGHWRVSVKTPNGQLLGRENFKIIIDNSVPVFETVVR